MKAIMEKHLEKDEEERDCESVTFLESVLLPACLYDLYAVNPIPLTVFWDRSSSRPLIP